MESIEKKLNGNIIISTVLRPKQLAVLQTLNDVSMEIDNPEELKEYLISTLKGSGYEAFINNNQGDYKLSKEGQVFGYLIPINPSFDKLTDTQRVFYVEVARNSSNAMHHLQLHKDLEEKVNQHERIKSILAHELKAPISSIHALTLLSLKRLKQIPNEEVEEVEEFLEKIKYGINILTDLSELLYLGSLSQEEISRGFEEIDFKETLLRNALFYDDYLEEHQIGLKVMYTDNKENPLRISFNKGILNAVVGTLFGNAVSYSPYGAVIYQGVKRTNDSLEIKIENLNANSKQIDDFGVGGGVGFPFVNSIVSNSGGKFETYKQPINPGDYEAIEQFGYEHAKNLEGYKTFGVKVSIPILTDTSKKIINFPIS